MNVNKADLKTVLFNKNHLYLKMSLKDFSKTSVIGFMYKVK